LAADLPGDFGGVPVEDLLGVLADPEFGGGVALVVKAPGGLPDVFDDVDEVHDDAHLDLAGGGLGLDALDLVVVAVDQRDPVTGVLGVAAVGLGEDLSDDACGVIYDAGRQPLVLGRRWGDRGVALGLIGGHDVRGGARGRGGVVDGADLGHALAVAFLAFGQPCLELVLRVGGLPSCGRSERVVAHHHALAVTRDDQRVTTVPGGLAGRVEAVEVDRGALGELLDLTLAQDLAGRALDRRERDVIGAPCGLDRRHAPQPVGMLLDGQVQPGVGGAQVRVPLGAVDVPRDHDRPEHAQQRASAPGLHAAAANPVSTAHRDPRLLLGAQVQMALQPQARQLAHVDLKTLLQISMCHARRRRALKPGDRALKRGSRRRKEVPRRSFGQDFSAWRVTFTTTGVELGDHAATPKVVDVGIDTPTFDTRLMSPCRAPNPCSLAQAPRSAATAPLDAPRVRQTAPSDLENPENKGVLNSLHGSRTRR
jgi:hypothetical protein